MVTSRNEHVQRHGVITITFHSGGTMGASSDNPGLNWKMSKINEGTPLHFPAVHLCYSDEMWKKHYAIIKTALKMNH